MPDPQKKVDDLIDVGAFVRSASPTTFLYHALQFEYEDTFGYWTVTSPTLPAKEPLAIINFMNRFDFGERAAATVPQDGEGRAWYVDYDRMIYSYSSSPDWLPVHAARWETLAIAPKRGQFFATPRQAMHAALEDPMVQARIKRYHLAEGLDLAKCIQNDVLWERRLNLVTEGLARAGWRPARVGIRPGGDSLFAITEGAAEDANQAAASVQAALEAVGLKPEGIQMVRRAGGSMGPWQADFRLLPEAEEEFDEISPEDIAVPAVEQIPGVKSVRLANSIARALKAKLPSFSSLTMDVSFSNRNPDGWPNLLFYTTAWKKWPMWGFNPETGRLASEDAEEYPPEFIRQAILDTCKELGLTMRPYKASMLSGHRADDTGIALDDTNDWYNAIFMVDPVEHLIKSPYYEVRESLGIDPHEFLPDIERHVSQIPGQADRKYLTAIRDALTKYGRMDVKSAILRPLHYTKRDAVGIYIYIEYPRNLSEPLFLERCRRAIEDGGIEPYWNMSVSKSDQFKYLLSWNQGTKCVRPEDRREVIIESHGIDPSEVAKAGMDMSGFEDFAKFRRLIGIVISKAPEGVELNCGSDSPLPTWGKTYASTVLSFTTWMDKEKVKQFVMDAMEMLDMRPIKDAKTTTYAAGDTVVVSVYHRRKSEMPRVYGYHGLHGGSIDDRFNVSMRESQEDEINIGTEWIPKAMSKADPWWDDRMRIARCADALAKAGFIGDVSFHPPIGNYTSFGELILHLKFRNPSKIGHRAKVAKLVNPILYRHFRFRLSSFQSIIPQYEGRWRHTTPEDRRAEAGWYTIKSQIQPVNFGRGNIDRFRGPDHIKYAIGEAEEDEFEKMLLAGEQPFNPDVDIDIDQFVQQADPRLRRDRMIRDVAAAIKALGYTKGNIEYYQERFSNATLDIALDTGIEWTGGSFETQARHEAVTRCVPIQQAIAPIFQKHGYTIHWNPDNPNALHWEGTLSSRYGPNHIMLLGVVRIVPPEEDAAKYPYYKKVVELPESVDIDPDELYQAEVKRWHYALVTDRNMPEMRYWCIYYGLDPRHADVSLRRAIFKPEADIKEETDYLNWLEKQPGWAYEDGFTGGMNGWMTPQGWVKAAMDAGLWDKYAIGRPGSKVQEAVEEMDPSDFMQDYMQHHWNYGLLPSPETGERYWYIWRGTPALEKAKRTDWTRWDQMSQSHHSIRRATKYYNWLEKQKGWAYDPNRWQSIGHWVDDSINLGLHETWLELGGDLAESDEVGIDPDDIFQSYAKTWRVAVVQKPVLRMDPNAPQLYSPVYVVFRGRSPEDNTGYYDYQGEYQPREQARKQAEYMCGLFNYAEQHGASYDEREWRGDIRQWMYYLKGAGISKGYEDARSGQQNPFFECQIKEMEDEDFIDPSTLYGHAMRKSLAGTKAPIYRMAQYLRDMGYEGYISVHDPASSEAMPRRHRTHLFVIHLPGDWRAMTAEQHERAVDQAIAAAGYNPNPKTGLPYRSQYRTYTPAHPITQKDTNMLTAALPIKGALPAESGMTVNV